MKTKIHVLKTLIDNYPIVANHVIAEANPMHPLSGLQRLRELRKNGVKVEFNKRNNTYTVHTPKSELNTMFLALRYKPFAMGGRQ
ncbi:MAG: hypothetical protein WC373_08555 [Smithella sp.]|jgi:hypothetical protein